MSSIASLLTEELIILPMHAVDRDSAVQELVQRLVDYEIIDSEAECLDSILKRERRMSTGVGKGVALPHGLSECVADVVMVFGIAPEGIDFNAVDGALCHIFVLLISPTSQPQKHLKLLTRLTKLLSDGELRTALIETTTSEEVIETLYQWEVGEDDVVL